MQFSFATAGHIAFGAGTVVQAVGEAAHMEHRALLVTGRTPSRAIDIGRQLEKAGWPGYLSAFRENRKSNRRLRVLPWPVMNTKQGGQIIILDKMRR
jgi:hypothetical protein